MVSVALRVLRAEGPAAARDRLLDRLEESRSRRRFRPAREGETTLAAPLLDVLATPPVRRLGGVQIQFLSRIAAEAEERVSAIFHPQQGGYRLARQSGDERHALDLHAPELAPPPALRDATFEAALTRAAAIARTRAVHVEGLAGLPVESLLALGRAGMRFVLSLHDFSLFCVRPNLLEEPTASFCGYCRDDERCHRCLRCDWDVAADFQRRRRAIGAELARAAEAVVYPSAFLRAKIGELVPGLEPARQRVIEPGGPAPLFRPDSPRATVRHVALVGGAELHKGALVFAEVARRLSGAGLRWTVFGGGDAELLHRLRRLPGVSVRGYYRAGRLPELLREHEVDLALLLSIVPESYGLTLDECRSAGVPVIAFDLGAVAERIRRDGGGLLVAPELGAEGMLAALRELCAGRRSLPPPISDRPWGPAEAARAHLALYRELGFL